MKNTLFILGAPDPEMELIERITRTSGASVAHATLDRQRIHPGNAYKANGTLPEVNPATDHFDRIILVECQLPGDWHGRDITDDIITVDHHHPGDPGYGRPPAEFFQASSLGQIVQILPGALQYGCRFPEEPRFIAAADHCLEAAYRGKCPGVDPEALMEWRATSRAVFQKKPVSEILEAIWTARELLAKAPNVVLYEELTASPEWEDDPGLPHNLPQITVRDTRGIWGGKPIPELPEAAARDGMAFIATVRDRDGRQKVVIQAANPEQIRAFLDHWAPAQRLVDCYGDPQRGFAGGYLP